MDKEPMPKQLADRINANTLDRESEIEHFMEDVASAADVPEFESSLREFMTRIDEDLFELITSEMRPVVINSFGASTAFRLTFTCHGTISPYPLQKTNDAGLTAHIVPVVVIGGGFMRRTPLGRVGEIAHEFAHAVLQSSSPLRSTHTRMRPPDDAAAPGM